MLPDHITTEVVRNASDHVCSHVNNHDLIDIAIDDAMQPHLEFVIEEITTRLKLTEEQDAELRERICWRLELLPLPGNSLRERVRTEFIEWHRDEVTDTDEATRYADRLLKRLEAIGLRL